MSDGVTPGTAPSSSVPEKQKPETVAEVIQEKAPEILEAIPVDTREKLKTVTIERHQISMRAGPLPDPAELAAYNQIIPNGADRILRMVENQSAHRIEIEKIAVSSQQRQGFCGQLFGLIIGLAGLVLATYAAINGQSWFGSIIGGTTLVSLVSAFLVSKNNQKKELSHKHEQVAPQTITPPATVIKNQNNKRGRGRR